MYIYIYTQQKYCVYTICIHWCSIFSINNSRPISQLLNIRHFASLWRCASTISSTHATSGAASLSVRQTTTSRPGEETLWKQRFLCEDFWGDNMKACQLVVVLFLSFLFGGYICVHFTNSKAHMSYSLDWRMAGWCGMPWWNASTPGHLWPIAVASASPRSVHQQDPRSYAVAPIPRDESFGILGHLGTCCDTVCVCVMSKLSANHLINIT